MTAIEAVRTCPRCKNIMIMDKVKEGPEYKVEFTWECIKCSLKIIQTEKGGSYANQKRKE